MKALFCLVLFVLAAGFSMESAHAQNYGQFLGRFTVDQAACAGSMFRDQERAYISLKTDKRTGKKEIYLQAYGQDAALEIIPLGKGQRQAPGTDPKFHGEVTEKWQTTVVDNALTYENRVNRPSRNIKFVEKIYLVSTSDSVFFQYQLSQAGSDKTENCRLIRKK